MEYLVIGLVSFVASLFTLFSGFGLGTILLPTFAIFFRLELAIAMTAVVHLSNNLFKLLLLGRYADKKVVFSFGIPALITAIAGSMLLIWISWFPTISTYELFGRKITITIIKALIGSLMIVFALFEVVPRLSDLTFERKYLPLGGILSGFFGGLSGHQGALRSAFLIKAGLPKEVFIGTGVAVACFVDVSRLFVYGSSFLSSNISDNSVLIITAIVCAFLGAWLGNRILKKVTLKGIQVIVGILLIVIGFCLGLGIL